HDNGGMACRTPACLPALTGAYAAPHGGALLSSTAGFGFDYSVLERPDLQPAPPARIVNMIHLGRVLTDGPPGPAIRALYVYSSNPAAVCPNQTLVLEGLAREDLFTVVHEQVLTDTAYYADLVLPATTSMEHLDLYRSYGQFTLRLARQGLPALPTYLPLAEGPENRELAARYPLQCLVPPNRFFLNSSFSQSALLRRRQGTPTVMMAPDDAARRGIVDGDAVTVESQRGAARFTARVTDATRPGVVVI